MDSVNVGVPEAITASSQVTVISTVSPTPYASSVAATELKSGASPSMVTVPKSPDAAPAAPPAASVIMPLKDVTFKSELAVLPSTTT